MKERLTNFKNYIIKLEDIHSIWVAAPTIKNININIEDLENMGGNYLSRGLNCSADDRDGNFEKYKDLIIKHIEFQENLFKKLTDIDIEILYFPKICNIYGKKIDKNTIIPITFFRLGYYANILKNTVDLNKHKTIIEIGAGYGGLCHILNKLTPMSTYIIIDIFQTLVNISYILHKCNLPFLFCNEIDDINHIIEQEKNIIILAHPDFIQKINKCDIILAMDCLSEFPKNTIHYYFNNIKRLDPEVFYFDYTNQANGNYVTKMKDILEKDYQKIFERKTPITCYMCPYISPTYGIEDLMKEIIYIKK